jgi:hypothetical protein
MPVATRIVRFILIIADGTFFPMSAHLAGAASDDGFRNIVLLRRDLVPFPE